MLACLILVLAFGLPIFLLPEKIEPEEKDLSARDSLWIARYNEFAAKGIWKETIKPIVDKSLGGTLRLFVQKVYEGSYFTRNEETVLSISASMPNGTTLDQMNHLINRMEAYLSTYKEIRQFQTSIYNARQASINVYFTRENERSGFPYTLKSRVISKALELGGGSWGVWDLWTKVSAMMSVRTQVLSGSRCTDIIMTSYTNGRRNYGRNCLRIAVSRKY